MATSSNNYATYGNAYDGYFEKAQHELSLYQVKAWIEQQTLLQRSKYVIYNNIIKNLDDFFSHVWKSKSGNVRFNKKGLRSLFKTYKRMTRWLISHETKVGRLINLKLQMIKWGVHPLFCDFSNMNNREEYCQYLTDIIKVSENQKIVSKCNKQLYFFYKSDI